MKVYHTIPFDEIRRGDRVTIRMPDGREADCEAICETVRGWRVRHRNPVNAWEAFATETGFVRASRKETSV